MSESHEEQDHQPDPGSPAEGAKAGEAAGRGLSDERLAAELRARYGRQPFVSASVHEAVMNEAESHFAAIRHQRAARRRRRWLSYVSAAAAAAVLAASLWMVDPFGADGTPQAGRRTAGQPPAPADAEGRRDDVNGDGAVDVLDLLVLARRHEQGRPFPAGPATEGGQRVTEQDLAALGERIVALEPRPDAGGERGS